jgi:hypothetical protein
VNTNIALDSIKENNKILAKHSLGHYKLKQHKTMVSQRMFKITRKKKEGSTAAAAESKPNK